MAFLKKYYLYFIIIAVIVVDVFFCVNYARGFFQDMNIPQWHILLLLLLFCSVIYEVVRWFRNVGRTFLPILLPALFLVFFLTFGALSCPPEPSRRIACASNMKQIALALAMYAGDNNGEYPPELRLIYDQNYLTDRKVYFCGMDQSWNAHMSKAGWCGSSYLYQNPGKTDKTKKSLLLEEKMGNHLDQYRNRVYSDGSLEGPLQRQFFNRSPAGHKKN